MRFPFRNLQRLWSEQDIVSKWVIAGALVLILFAYLPTLQFDYATQDQWRAFRYAPFGGTALSRATSCLNMLPTFYIQTGRPLVWMGECVEHAAVYRISDFAYLRPFVLLVVLVTVIELGRTLAPWLGGLALGVAAAAAFVVSPGYSFMYLQSMPALMVLIALLLAARSYRLCSERQQGGKWHIAMAGGIFFVACLIYPAYAFCVVTLALVEFGFDTSRNLPTRLKRLGITLAIYACCTLLYFLFVKASIAMLSAIEGPLPALGPYDVTPHLDPGTVLRRVIGLARYLYKIPPLNFMTPRGVNFGIVVAFSCGTAWLTSWSRQRSILTVCAVSLLNVGIVSVLLVGAVSPWLLSQFPNMTTRQTLPVNLFFCAAVFGLLNAALKFCPSGISRWIPVIAAGCLLFPVTLVQNRLSFLEIVVDNTEIEDLRLNIAQWVRDAGWINDRAILVILPGAERPAAVEHLVNNTGYGNENNALALHHTPISLPWMLGAVLREQSGMPHSFALVDCADDESCAKSQLLNPRNVVVNYSAGAAPIHVSTPPFVINLSLLTSHPVVPDIIVTPDPVITVSSEIPGLGPAGLLLAEEPGWHAARDPAYPQTVTIDFKQVDVFKGLDLLPQDGSETRMPKSVIILTSNDGYSWSRAASPQNLCASIAPDGWHDIQFPAPVSARYLKLQILANCGDPDFLTIRGLRPE